MNETDYWIQLDKALKADREFSGLSQKKRDGTATLEEVQKYQYRAAQIESEFLSKHLSEPGTGENSERCYELMKRRYQKVNQALSEAQEKLDEQAGLKIKAQKAKFPSERARQIANSLEDQTVPVETIQRRAQSAVANIGNSFCDDYVQENAKFRSNAGIKCYITRTTTGKCCAWCTQIAGRYEYGRHPADIFRRHDNCDCTVTYEEGKKHQNVWTKKTWSAPDIPAEAMNFKPTVFTPEQARAIERQNLQYKGLAAENSKLKTDTPQTIVDTTMLRSSEYRRLFDQLGESPKITREIFQRSRAMLEHRTGTEFEDLVFIGSDGKVLSRTDYDHPREVMPTKKMKQMVLKSPANSVISIHNHPGSAVPSIADINSARNHQYKYGVITCHNGNLFKYTIVDNNYDEHFVDTLLDNVNKALYNKNDDELNSKLDDLEKFGVKLEVIRWK